jgi:hypothetical protein
VGDKRKREAASDGGSVPRNVRDMMFLPVELRFWLPRTSGGVAYSPGPFHAERWRQAMVTGGAQTKAPPVAPRRGSLRDEHTVHEELDRAGGQTGGVHGVVAGEGVDLEPVVSLGVEDRDRRDEAADLHFA